MMGRTVLVVLVGLVAFVTFCGAETWYLDASQGNDHNNCTQVTEPCQSFGRVLTVVGAGDIIKAKGTFTPSGTLVVSVPLTIMRTTDTFTVLQPRNGATFVFQHGSELAVLRGAEFRGASANTAAVVVKAGSVLSLEYCAFNGCQGGGMSIVDQSQVSIVQTQWSNNFIPISVINSNLTCSDSGFQNNRGQACGGAIVATAGASVSLDTVSFSGNTAASGGAICVQNGALIFQDVQCQNNAALTKSGGCVYLSGNPTMQSSISASTEVDPWSGNTAAAAGGAIYTADMQQLVITGLKLSKNQAASVGGAIACNGTTTVLLESVVCSQNSAIQYGGCLYANRSSLVGITGSSLLQNSAGAAGAFYGLLATISVKSSQVQGNSATKTNGGAFELSGGALSAESSTFSGNRVNEQGSAAGGLLRDSHFSFQGVNVEGNTYGVANETPYGMEGVVCVASSGSVSAMSAELNTTEYWVCAGTACQLTLNGDSSACASQPPGAPSARWSYVTVPVGGISLSTVEQAFLPVQIYDAYNRSVALSGPSDLQTSLKNANNGLTVLASVQVIPGAAVGAYTVTFFVNYAGAFDFYLELVNSIGGKNDIVNSPVSVTAVDKQSAPDLTALWIVLALVGALGCVILAIVAYRRYAKRKEYAPLADGSSTTRRTHYGGVGFATETESEEV